MTDAARWLPALDDGAALAWARRPGGRSGGAGAAHGEAGGPRPEAVRAILDEVREGGDAALLRLAERHDGGAPSALRVPAERCRDALAALRPERRAALELARDNLLRWHEAQRRRELPLEVRPGVRTWREFRPIRRVGLYAPGGGAAYPSSLLMAAVPARVAGCAEIVACSPAGPSGEPAEAVLAAAALAGVDELYAVGGAHAMAALAYGTETIAPVDKIFGPGGAWVNAAKLALFEVVAVDLPAGPSEVAVWTTPEADPDLAAAELVAQAEHGPDSRCALVVSGRNGPTDGAARADAFADAVRARVVERLGRLPEDRRSAAAASLRAGVTVVAADDAAAARWIDEMAPEHLAIHGADATGRLALVSHAGAVFLGERTPVAAGDYCTGANHVLPTGRRARGSGGLDLDAFGRWLSVQCLEDRGLRRLAPAIEVLAEWEGLPGHGAAARAARVAAEAAEAAEAVR